MGVSSGFLTLNVGVFHNLRAVLTLRDLGGFRNDLVSLFLKLGKMLSFGNDYGIMVKT